MRVRLLYLFVLTAVLAACANPTAQPKPPSPAVPTNFPTNAFEKIPVVQVSLPAVIDANPGGQAVIPLRAQPMYVESGKTTSGALYTSLTPWENANIAEMRLCYEINKPCVPDGNWVPFVPEWNTTVDVNWLGERTFWLSAQFRDVNGKLIRAYNPSNPVEQLDSGATKIVLNGMVNMQTPLAAQPAFVQTAVAATRVAYPVSGSLVLQNGLCCAGGKVGTTIELNAAFEATSPNTTVTQMRLLNHCGAQSEMNTAPWEPFVKQKTFPYKIVAANWVGWYLAVQYRDANGNLSPIYCADISVEGMTP